MFFDVDSFDTSEGVDGLVVEVLAHGFGERFHAAAFGVPEFCVGAEGAIGFCDGAFDGGLDGWREDAVGDPIK